MLLDAHSILHPRRPTSPAARTEEHRETALAGPGGTFRSRGSPGPELGLDTVVTVSVPSSDCQCPQRGCSSMPSPERLQLPASRARVLSITVITPCSLINSKESKDPKAMIVINNHLVAAELIFQQGLPWPRRETAEREGRRKEAVSGAEQPSSRRPGLTPP